jgi:NitT/TauT family transport system permease protein
MWSKLSKVTVLRPLPLTLFILVWQFTVGGDDRLTFFFGTPLKIADYLIKRTFDGSLPVDFGITFAEAAIGFIIGNIIGTAIGLSLWYSRTTFQIARPYIVALGSAPIFAFAPILIMWFGTGMFSKIAIAALSTVFIALLQAYTGADEVSNDYIRLMKTFGASKSQTFRKIIAPSSIVWVMSAFKMNVGFAILGAFIGEFLSSNRGLGHLILVASGLFDISLMLTGILMLVVIALILTWCVNRLEPLVKKAIVTYL